MAKKNYAGGIPAAKKVTVTNMLTNGSLANGHSGWTINSNNTATDNNGYLTIKCNVTASSGGTYSNYQEISVTGRAPTTRQLLYVCAKVRGRSANQSSPRVYLRYYQNGSTTASQNNMASIDGLTGASLNDGNWHIFSLRVQTYALSSGNYFDYARVSFGINNATAGDIMDIKEIFLCNLTECFGFGNEPDKAWCDANLTNIVDMGEVTRTYSDVVANKTKKLYWGKDGVARRVKKVYIGDENNIAQLSFNNGVPTEVAQSTEVAAGYGFNNEDKLRCANGLWVWGDGYSSSPTGLWYSEDGKSWEQSNITSLEVGALEYGNGVWVAGSRNNKGLYYSNDGKTWTQSNITTGIFPSGGVRYANGRWVAVTDYDASSRCVCYSNNGMSWETVSATGYCLMDRGLAVGYVKGVLTWVFSNSYGTSNQVDYYSTDNGKTWTSVSGGTNPKSPVTYGNGIFVGGSYKSSSPTGLWYSEDGKSWKQSNVTSGAFYTVVYKGGLWIAGSGGRSSKDGLYYSTDGKTWTRSNITTGAWTKCCYNGSAWTVWSYNYDINNNSSKNCDMYYSLDGKTWEYSGLSLPQYSGYTDDVVWQDDKLVAHINGNLVCLE